MNTVKLVAVFAENRPGQAARITEVLARANINIRCITVASSGGLRRDEVTGQRSRPGLSGPQRRRICRHPDRRDRRGNGRTGQARCTRWRIAWPPMILIWPILQASLPTTAPSWCWKLKTPRQAADVLAKQGLHVLTQEETLTV